MSEQEPRLNPLTQHPHLAEYPYAIQDVDFAHELAKVEKPYRELAAQATALGKQAVEREQANAEAAHKDNDNKEPSVTKDDLLIFSEEHGYDPALGNRTWNALMRDGGMAFDASSSGSYMYDLPRLHVRKVYEKLDDLVPEGASYGQKLRLVRSLGMRQFGVMCYELLLEYCQEKLQDEQ